MSVYFWHIYCTVKHNKNTCTNDFTLSSKSVMTLVFLSTGIGLTLNDVQYTNNSVVTITDIGTASAALLCTTTNSGCCSSGNPTTQWYFPTGSQVPNRGVPPPSMTFSRTRSTSPGTVLLHRNSGATTTGVFHCDILDASGDIQSLYVGIYTATTGESCTFCMTYFLTEYRGGCETL